MWNGNTVQLNIIHELIIDSVQFTDYVIMCVTI